MPFSNELGKEVEPKYKIPDVDKLPIGRVDNPFRELGMSMYSLEKVGKFDVSQALQIFREVIKILNDALSIWEKIMIFIGRLDPPELSETEKVFLIKEIPLLSKLDLEARNEYYRSVLLQVK